MRRLVAGLVIMVAAFSLGGCDGNSDTRPSVDTGPDEAGATRTLTQQATTVVDIPDYRIVDVEDASHKALERPLSSYSVEELEALPVDKKFIYRVVVSPELTNDQVRPLIDHIIGELTAQDNDIDEIVIFLYSDEALVDGPYDIGTATWAPGGELGNMTPHIASTNEREGYETSIDVREDLEDYLRQRGKEELKFGLTEAQRRQFFKDIVAAEDRAQAEADRLYPTDISNPDWEANLTRNKDTFDELADQFRAEVRQQYGVNEDQQREITSEAFREGWPLD